VPRPSAPQRPASAHATRAVALRCGDMNRSSHQGKAAGENPKAKTKHCLALPCPRVRHGSQARERSTKKPGSCTRTAEATRANDSDAHARRRHAPSGSAVHGSCLASTVRPVQRRTRMAAWLTGRADGRPGSMGVSPLSLLAFSWRARVTTVVRDWPAGPGRYRGCRLSYCHTQEQ
jgi:hypothetical protein